MEHLHTLHTDIEPPERFTYPFAYKPHPLCQLAAREVQSYIAAHPEICADADTGKMFGVLVVGPPLAPPWGRKPKAEEGLSRKPMAEMEEEMTGGRVAFLAAYSGLLAGRNDWPYFVPPVFDAQQPDGYFKTMERKIMERSRTTLPPSPFPEALPSTQTTPKEMSQDLQMWLFHQYQMLNARGETKDLVTLWQEYYSRPKLQRKFPLPPGGTGDCCAPKLLQYAYQQGLKPLCMAEFWWGAPTKTELRHHLHYYPACRGKCKPILTWMLQGLEVDPDPELLGFEHLDLPVVYEDADLLVVNKPSGLLSTPGRIEQYSVETLMHQRYPGSVIAHRLDMPTSGLLIVAKSLDVYRPLQEQFVRHQVRKKYIAMVEWGGAEPGLPPISHRGTISLPLRPDPMNRPRQVVDMEHGKRAVTDYEFLDYSPSTHHLSPSTRLVALYPQTGRTHQLRIHCAHPDGLGCPIVGDELYGYGTQQRLMLHAAEIWFRHPVTDEPMHFVSPPPFL